MSPTLGAAPVYPQRSRGRAFRERTWALALALLLASLGTGILAGPHPDRGVGETASGPPSAGDVTWALLDPPSPPRNLRASAGDGHVDLGWDANPVTDLVTGYNIYRGQSSGGESYLASVGLLDTSYTDSAVQNGVTY
ncbi:MAG TPA: fibronectin type III domain-containing protein, partial [Thermoplasmata archaeon]|nr:fibronectin type III domain-containing protein [Thermoplasmata archaeon]